VLGSLLIGFLMGLSERSVIISNEVRLFLMVGICGGFTTFSSFTMENLTLMHNGQVLQVLVYSASSILFGFIAVYAGYVVSNLF
jgi:CrcB protein